MAPNWPEYWPVQVLAVIPSMPLWLAVWLGELEVPFSPSYLATLPRAVNRLASFIW